MESKRTTWIIVSVLILAVAGVFLFGLHRKSGGKDDLVIPDGVQFQPDVTKPVPTGEPVSTPTPEILPTPTPMFLREYENVSVEVDNIELYDTPKAGQYNYDTVYYLRSEPGRTAERIIVMPKKIDVQVNSICTNLFHEPWYCITFNVNDKEYTGFVQWSTVAVEDVVHTPDPEADGSLHLAEPIENPTETLGADNDGDGIYNVVLDPGHGGRDGGAYYYSTNEKDIDFKVANYCKAYLDEHYENVVVSLTRTEDKLFDPVDTNDDLEYRVRFAMEKNADVMVSMHFNTGSKKLSGSLALVPKRPGIFEKDVLLASYIVEGLKTLGIENEGIKWKKSSIMYHLDDTPMDGYLVLRLTAEVGIPSCIIEHCYMDNKNDRQFWNTEEKLQQIGESDAVAIARFLGLKEK